ncbi:DUF3048 C-terminal domain-containing protein [Bacillus licheniformis]|nr:DUF3048 C-terminal domain-containing protein [Bacillus licheniformis]
MRKSDGVLTTDLETEEPVVLQNILIAEAEHHMKDAYGRRDIDLRSGGKGLLLQTGKSIGSAGRTKTAGSYRRLTANRSVRAGKTWINIVPDLSKVSISKGEGV